MHKRFFRFLLTIAAALSLVVSLGACSRNAASLDKMEERDPFLKKAQSRKDLQDIDGAIDLYNRALERRPTLARGHLELGLLYDTHKQDYIRAIYHYQRYLELRPQTEKRKLIEDLIRQARLSFAASLPHQPAGAVEEIALLKSEISVLRAQLGGGAPAPAPASAAAPAAKTTAKAAPAAPGKLQPPQPEPAQPAVRTYVVQNGDTLSSIAGKELGDVNKWRAIFEANRATLPSPQSVKVGQTLIIPR